ncbi:MAG: hypothetical protein ACI8V5_001446 [Limisphaerales bacterium]|jgi:hypothetical protein
MNPKPQTESAFTRRDFFARMKDGVYGAALLHLLGEDGLISARGASNEHAGPPVSPNPIFDLKPKLSHHRPRAKSVIHLFQNGGPSQMDLFDPKPELQRHMGKTYPGKLEAIGNQDTVDIGALMGTPFKFKRHGQSGTWMSDALPHLSTVADELCFTHSMWTDHPNHDNALYKIHTGRLFMGSPSLGSWVVYGLGSENQNLPAYVVLDDPLGLPKNGVRNWTSAFLPPLYQGTRFRTKGSPILNLTPEYEQPSAVSEAARKLLIDMDREHRDKRPGYLELDARIDAYSLAGRMQLYANDVLDISDEDERTKKDYGIGGKYTDSYGRRCLLARRLIERGVRFVQLFLDDQPWDNHSNLKDTMLSACARTDQPVAALIRDLKERGLLDDTLVVWGGEFGRTPTSQRMGTTYTGRDHNMQAFSSWMAGGGVKPGFRYGETDELGHAVVKDPISVHDFHATILHALGLHHQKTNFERNGLHEKLTGVKEPRVVEEIFA